MWGPILGGFAILSAFLTLTAWINGRIIKKYLGDLIKAESESTRKMISEVTEKISNLMAAETGKISDLIVAEANNTRELIRLLK